LTELDLTFLLLWLPLALGAFTLYRRLTSLSRRSVSDRCTWELALPRAAHFSVPEATAWFRSLAPLFTRETVSASLELQGEGRQLRVLLTAPRTWEETLRAQLTAWFPEARLDLVETEAQSQLRAVTTLQFSQPEYLPLAVLSSRGPDPLLGLLGLLTAAEDRCGLQLTWGPPPSDWRHWAPVAREALREGASVPPRGRWFWPILLWHSFQRPAQARRAAGNDLPPDALRAAEVKLQQPVFTAQLQVWAEVQGEGDQSTADARVAALAAQLELKFGSPTGNGLVRGNTVRKKGSFRDPATGHSQLVCTAAELATLFHLPAGEHLLVPREHTRQVPPRPELLLQLTGGERTWLGEALTREGPVRFGMSPEERRLHTYVVGKTGTGKSTLLVTLLRQDLEAGRGVGLIDPHGDLAEQVLSLVPEHRQDEVLYFNAADTEYPVGFNLLASTVPERRPLVASGVISVFKKLYGESWGPRLEHFLRNAVLVLLESPHPTLLALPRLLTDRGFRQRCLTHVRDPLLRTFFLEEFEAYDPRWRAEALSPILNKVGQFLASPVVRHLVGQSQPGFDLRELLDRGGIFVANLASGKIGEDNSALLGGLLVAGFQLAAMSRAEQPETERRDFALCVDEFQHFANDAFAVILSEARKYRLSLTLSHQYLDQVPPGVSDAVFGNVGSICVFRVGAGDTTRLARELAPTFDGQDLVHLPNHHFSCRIARATGTAPAFSARTLTPSAGTGVVADLVHQSRAKWSRPRAEVELEIADLWEGRAD